MTLTREQAVKLLVAMNYKTAGKWSTERLQNKVDSFIELAAEEEIVINNEKMQLRFKRIIKALKNGKTVTIEDTAEDAAEDAAEVADTKQKTSKKKKVKKSKKAVVEQDDDDVDDDEEEPVKEKKPQQKKSQQKKMNRHAAATKALMSKKNLTMEEYIERANEVYMKFGGADNMKESAMAIAIVLKVAEEMGTPFSIKV